MAGEFALDADGVHLEGRLEGRGDPLLLLHGGPGLGFEYVDGLVVELRKGFEVASYQQRGLPPSQVEGPFAVADHVADARRVLDAQGWDRAVVVGHSWGGHLALHVALALRERVRAVVAVDPLGAVGDGGSAQFEAELAARTPEAARSRVHELDERASRGAGTPEEALESLRLVWPAYFPTAEAAPPMPDTRIAVEGFVATCESLERELPALEASLPLIATPTCFVIGEHSPMPRSASGDTAARIPGARVEVVPGAGHFVWLDSPGAVRVSLDRLLAS